TSSRQRSTKSPSKMASIPSASRASTSTAPSGKTPTDSSSSKNSSTEKPSPPSASTRTERTKSSTPSASKSTRTSSAATKRSSRVKTKWDPVSGTRKYIGLAPEELKRMKVRMRSGQLPRNRSGLTRK